MELVVDKTNKKIKVIFSDGSDFETELRSSNAQSLINKINYLQKDFEFITKNIPEFEEVYQDLLYNVVNKDIDNMLATLEVYADKFIDLLGYDLSKYCDATKRTSSSIYMNEDEVKQVLRIIFIIKMLAILIHSEEYQVYMKRVLNRLARRYKTVNEKLYNLIRYKIQFSLFNKGALQFLKYALSENYLVLYNFDFVMLTAIVFFDFYVDMNPVSFIVSVATDNANYAIMSYSNNPLQFSEDFETSNDNSHLLLTISDHLFLNKVSNIVSEMLKENNYNIISDAYPTPIYDKLIIPFFMHVSGVTKSTLEQYEDKFKLQFLFFYLIKKNKILGSRFKQGKKLLLSAFNHPVTKTSSISPVIVRSLTKNISIDGLKSKTLLIDYLQEISVIQYKSNSLINFLTGSKIDMTNREIQSALIEIVDFIFDLINTMTRDNIVNEARKTLKDVLKFDEVSANEFKTTISYTI